MPVAVDLDLRHPEWMDAPPAKLHGLACSVFEHEASDHDTADKAFTIWPLRSSEAAGRSTLRLISLIDTLPATVPERGQIVRFGGARCTVMGRTIDRAPFAVLAGGPPTREARFVFHTPTFFSAGGVRRALLDPALILSSLGRRWNAHAPALIPDELMRELTRGVRIVDWEARTMSLEAGRTGTFTGFVGNLTVSLPQRSDSACGEVLGALTRAAQYLGVGSMCTYGFGVATGETR